MCLICYSTITVATLIAPNPASITSTPAPTASITSTPAPTASISPITTPKSNIVINANRLNNITYSKEDIIFTEKPCNKKQLNTIKKELICLKNKNLYRWAKIKKIPTPSPTPINDPTLNPVPIPVKTPIGVAEVIKSFIEFTKNDIEPQQIVYNTSPNADIITSTKIEKNVNNIIKIFAPYDQHQNPFQVFISSPMEIDWTLNEWNKYNLTDPYTITVYKRDISPFIIFPSRVTSTWNENWEGTFTYNPPAGDFTSTIDEQSLTTWRYYDGDGSKGHIDAEDKARKISIAHHVIHSIQSRITGGRINSLGCWGAEGGAEFYGILSSTTFDNLDYLEYRNNHLTQFTRKWPVPPKPGTDLRKYDNSQWLELLKNLECTPGNDSNTYNLQYSVGILLYEKLALDFGHKKIMEWWHEMRNESRCVHLSHENKDCWKEPFLRVFNIDIDTWYSNNAIPYLIEEYSTWNTPTWWTGVGGKDYREKQIIS